MGVSIYHVIHFCPSAGGRVLVLGFGYSKGRGWHGGLVVRVIYCDPRATPVFYLSFFGNINSMVQKPNLPPSPWLNFLVKYNLLPTNSFVFQTSSADLPLPYFLICDCSG